MLVYKNHSCDVVYTANQQQAMLLTPPLMDKLNYILSGNQKPETLVLNLWLMGKEKKKKTQLEFLLPQEFLYCRILQTCKSFKGECHMKWFTLSGSVCFIHAGDAKNVGQTRVSYRQSDTVLSLSHVNTHTHTSNTNRVWTYWEFPDSKTQDY